ncbi:MAG: hypothetical protein FWF46_02190 [Oscillospiraceae bacterium]|nr:hypothetical protein [Oscillospiraceae bacterium]
MPRKSQYIYETTPKKIDYKSPKSRKERGTRNNSTRPMQKPLKNDKKKKKQTRKGKVKKQHKSVEKLAPKKVVQKKNNEITHGKAEVVTASEKKTKKFSKPKAIVYLIVAFSLLFFIGYRNTLIDQTFASLQKSKSNLAALQKEDQQLNVKIEDSINLDNIAKAASEKLGMQKLSSSQKIYLTLPKKDYVEPAPEKIVVEQDSWYMQIWKMIKNLF